MDAATVIAAARRRSGSGLRALARRAGTSHATLAAYEAGAKVPGVDTADRIVAATGAALEVGLAPRPDVTPEARRAKGEELVAALELAAAFPARHDAELPAPRFPATR